MYDTRLVQKIWKWYVRQGSTTGIDFVSTRDAAARIRAPDNVGGGAVINHGGFGSRNRRSDARKVGVGWRRLEKSERRRYITAAISLLSLPPHNWSVAEMLSSPSDQGGEEIRKGVG